MNPAGVVLIIAAVWAGCQIFGGDAFGRLGIIPKPAG
jgi:hypothetical protein